MFPGQLFDPFDSIHSHGMTEIPMGVDMPYRKVRVSGFILSLDLRVGSSLLYRVDHDQIQTVDPVGKDPSHVRFHKNFGSHLGFRSGNIVSY